MHISKNGVQPRISHFRNCFIGYSSHDDDDDSDPAARRASRSRRGKGKRVNLKEDSSSESDAAFNPSDESGDEEKTPRVTAKRRPGRVAKKPQESEEDVSEVEETPTSDDDSDVSTTVMFRKVA